MKIVGGEFMGRKAKTHEQFIKELSNINPNIEVLGEYKGTMAKIEVRCLTDGYTWYVVPNDLLRGHGCSICSGKKKSHEQFIKELSNINPNIEVLGKYKNNCTKIEVRCLLDGYTWNVVPNSLLMGHGCPICSYTKKKKTHEQFIEELNKINSNIEVIGKYKNNYTKIEVRCLLDGHIWNVVPSSLLSEHGCPICNASKGEKKVEEYLKNNNYKCVPQYKIDECRNKRTLPFDFAVFKEDKLLCLIEFQGIQHYKENEHFGGVDGFKHTQKNDLIKRNYCIANKIELITIPYWLQYVEEYLEERLLEVEELREVK